MAHDTQNIGGVSVPDNVVFLNFTYLLPRRCLRDHNEIVVVYANGNRYVLPVWR